MIYCYYLLLLLGRFVQQDRTVHPGIQVRAWGAIILVCSSLTCAYLSSPHLQTKCDAEGYFQRFLRGVRVFPVHQAESPKM
jgi:hypothetical protein